MTLNDIEALIKLVGETNIDDNLKDYLSLGYPINHIKVQSLELPAFYIIKREVEKLGLTAQWNNENIDRIHKQLRKYARRVLA